MGDLPRRPKDDGDRSGAGTRPGQRPLLRRQPAPTGTAEPPEGVHPDAGSEVTGGAQLLPTDVLALADYVWALNQKGGS